MGSVCQEVRIAGDCWSRWNEYVDSESDTAGDICVQKLLRIRTYGVPSMMVAAKSVRFVDNLLYGTTFSPIAGCHVIVSWVLTLCIMFRMKFLLPFSG
jgi:hypothetical protein